MCEIIRLGAYLNPFQSTSKFCSSFCDFFAKNVREDGVNRKTVRFFDTLGKWHKSKEKNHWPEFC